VAAGSRRNFDVITVPAAHGSAGLGIDATEADLLRAELKRMIEAHRRILDQLTTGVAIFGSNQKLSFYNAAYRSLWDLDAGFLDQAPTDSAVLDQLRAARKLPDDQDFRQFKAALHEAYRAIEPKSDVWHLPSGRTMRVVTTPNPEGGVIYLFDDVTERLDLERRFDALIRVQGETLDNLAEAVAVFGSDGRLRLFNPVFAQMWKFDPAALQERPHIEAVIGWCHALAGDNPVWPALRATVTAIDGRAPVNGEIERRSDLARRVIGAAQTMLDEVLEDLLSARTVWSGHVRAADLGGGKRALETIGGIVVEFHELFRRAFPIADVGLVPHLPPPALDFFLPITLDGVLHPLVDELTPLVIVLRRI
jgi:PAS domain-containing protein